VGSVTRSNVAELPRQRTVLRQIVARSPNRQRKLCTGKAVRFPNTYRRATVWSTARLCDSRWP
jgi:hypothetical protein